MSMASVITVVIALLAIFVLLVIILLYAYKRQKMCFKGKREKINSPYIVDSLREKEGSDFVL